MMCPLSTKVKLYLVPGTDVPGARFYVLPVRNGIVLARKRVQGQTGVSSIGEQGVEVQNVKYKKGTSNFPFLSQITTHLYTHTWYLYTMADAETYGNDQDSLPEPSAAPMVGATALTPDLNARDLLPNNNNRRRDPTGDQALMGANNEDGNVEGLEARDENGELVREEFLKFLQNL